VTAGNYYMDGVTSPRVRLPDTPTRPHVIVSLMLDGAIAPALTTQHRNPLSLPRRRSRHP
jgi:hypothetical protein